MKPHNKHNTVQNQVAVRLWLGVQNVTNVCIGECWQARASTKVKLTHTGQLNELCWRMCLTRHSSEVSVRLQSSPETLSCTLQVRVQPVSFWWYITPTCVSSFERALTLSFTCKWSVENRILNNFAFDNFRPFFSRRLDWKMRNAADVTFLKSEKF